MPFQLVAARALEDRGESELQHSLADAWLI
jgi:hypothetical protein